MAGPGGGSSGGGFGGGSFGGGGGGFSGGGHGFGGGSFGNHGGSFGGNNNGGHFGGHHGGHFGGHHHHDPHHHRPFFGGPFFGGGWGWGRRRYRTGGCGTGFIIALFIIFFALYTFVPEGDLFDDPFVHTEVYNVDVGSVVYDEATMQEYANENYKECFGDYDNYENNILLVFLTNDACDGYYTIAWVGDNIRSEINGMFGEYTEYGQLLNQYINTNYYAYSLDMNLSDVIMNMTQSITELGLDSSFRTDYPEGETAKSVLVNKTSLEMSGESLDVVLTNFTEKTGIPCVIVVDRSESVFGAPEASVTANEAVSVPPASVVDEEVITHDNEAETEIFIVQPTDTENDDSVNIAIIGGADGPTQISVGSGVSFTFVIAVVLMIIAIAMTVIFLRLKKKNGATAENSDGKKGKEEKPPWEL